MKNIIIVIQIVISILLAGSILLQSRGTGLGSTFGGGTEQYRSKRGFERLLFRLTIVLISLFFITSVLNLLAK